MKKDNRGITLVELIVTMAVLAVASAAIYGLVIFASNQFNRQNKDVEVQQEAQLTMNQIQDYLIDASLGISYKVGGGYVLDDSTLAADQDKMLTIYNNTTYYIIKWSSVKEEVYMQSFPYDEVGPDLSIEDNWKLMAEYVTKFNVDITDLEKKGIVRISLVYTGNDDYTLNKLVNVRNPVKVNKDIDDIY